MTDDTESSDFDLKHWIEEKQRHWVPAFAGMTIKGERSWIARLAGILRATLQWTATEPSKTAGGEVDLDPPGLNRNR
jgi:hypothetical protein